MPFATKEQKRAYDAARYATNREAIKDSVRAYRQTNPEKLRAYQAASRAAHVNERKAYGAEYYQANRECLDERNRVWRKAHPIERAKHIRAYKDRNPQAGRDYKKRRKARLRGARSIERFSATEIYERDGWKCGICGRPIERGEESLDHIIPVSKGGPHTKANVRAAHRVCNRNRGNRA